MNLDGEMEPTTPPKKKPMDTKVGFEPNQPLPNDPVLEIVSRCGTIGDAIRCAAASKSLRRGILNAPFLRRLRGFLNDGTEHGDGAGRPFFIPTLLLGLYQSGDPHLQPYFVPASGATKQAPSSLAALPPPPNRGGGCVFGPYLPVASCRSLLLLRRRYSNHMTGEQLIEHHGPHPISELSVCNPTTGQRFVLPPHHVQDKSHALLDVDMFVAPSWSFKLLVAEIAYRSSTLHVQIFSSDSEQGRGGWGPALACLITNRFGESQFVELGSRLGRMRPRPVVLGDTVCWLCLSLPDNADRILTWRWRGGVASAACVINPPPGYSLGRAEKCLIVLPAPAAAAGSHTSLLGMITIENCKNCELHVWACEKRGGGSAKDWKLWHVIKEVTIPRPPMGSSRRLSDADLLFRDAHLLWFCEGSGTLFLRPSHHGPLKHSLFSLDMSTLPFSSTEVSKVTTDIREWKVNPEHEFCPYEVDPLSHMLLMKQF